MNRRENMNDRDRRVPDAGRPTVGILYAGELGSALARLLTQQGYRVVTPIAGRSERTRRLAADAHVESIDTLADVARIADVVFSLVPPSAAVDTAQQYCAAADPDAAALFVDFNSIAPATALEVADVCNRYHVGCVDGAVHGMAARLPASGTLYLSGPAAPTIAALFAPPLRVNVLGPRIGQASTFKMLIAGLNKGVVALFVEMALAGRAAGVLDDLLACYRDAYPGIMALVDRLLPTYPQHAPRRADELNEVAQTLRSFDVEPRLIAAAQKLTAAIGRLSLEDVRVGQDDAEWTVSEVIEAVSARNPSTRCLQSHKTRETAMVQKPRSSELHAGPGFRVKGDFPRLDPRLYQQFSEFPTPDISDLLNRLYAMDPGITCLTGDHHALCGPACTVKVFPGDNLMVHKSLDVAAPGDIVVVDAGGSNMNAVLGDLVSTKAKHRHIAGFIIDGLIRDLPAIKALDFPVFARGTTPIGPLHRGPGEINYPICCGGIVVNPGDIIVADAAGIVLVPREIAEELLIRLQSHQEANAAYLASVKRGDFSNQWVDRLLDELNLPARDASEQLEVVSKNG